MLTGMAGSCVEGEGGFGLGGAGLRDGLMIGLGG